MFLIIKKKHLILTVVAILAVVTIALSFLFQNSNQPVLDDTTKDSKYIKWVEFNVPYNALEKAMNLDIKSFNEEIHLNWVDMLAYLASKYYGNFKNYKASDMDSLAKKLREGKTIDELAEGMKLFSYYREAYGAALGGLLGEYEIQVDNKENPKEKKYIKKYGLKGFSPVAKNYGFSHYDDFGNSRSYGYKRIHLGNDLVAAIGTPVVAVESGVVEALGWNQYGGWRIGIRSFDGKRYYYYGHLRKDHPYAAGLKEGQMVKAGDIIGYIGRTGYSTKENVNNITTPHLHFGLQLIFDESQKEALCELWIDVYNIVNLLKKNRSLAVKVPETKDFMRAYDIIDPATSKYTGDIPRAPIHNKDPDTNPDSGANSSSDSSKP